MCVVPVDVVIRRMSMLDDGLLVQFSSSAVRPVFLDPDGKVPAGFPDVDQTLPSRFFSEPHLLFKRLIPWCTHKPNTYILKLEI